LLYLHLARNSPSRSSHCSVRRFAVKPLRFATGIDCKACTDAPLPACDGTSGAPVEIISLTIFKTMRYMQQLEQKLKKLLKEADDRALIAFVKETVLESYRNGQRASKEPRRSRGK
jgi:hypothetical protein